MPAHVSAAIAAILLAQAPSLPKIDETLEQIHAVTPASAAPLCDRVIGAATTANGFDLFVAATGCVKAGRQDDAAFLMLAGQVRSMADMSLLKPDGPGAESDAASLYGLVFFHFGGPGPMEVYRDPARYKALMARHQAWEPVVSDSYDPGWAWKQPLDAAGYRAMIGEAKAHRRRQIADFVALDADPAYRAAREEFDVIGRRNPEGIQSDSADGKRAEELMTIMRAREGALARED